MVTSTQASAERFGSSRVHSLTRPNLVSVGTIVWLSSELMFFAGLFAMYFTVRANNLSVWPGAPAQNGNPPLHVHLTVPYATVFTHLEPADDPRSEADTMLDSAASPGPPSAGARR